MYGVYIYICKYIYIYANIYIYMYRKIAIFSHDFWYLFCLWHILWHVVWHVVARGYDEVRWSPAPQDNSNPESFFAPPQPTTLRLTLGTGNAEMLGETPGDGTLINTANGGYIIQPWRFCWDIYWDAQPIYRIWYGLVWTWRIYMDLL